MTPTEEKFLRYWAQKSNMGRMRYSLYHGALTFGLLMLAGNLVIGQFLFDNPLIWERVLIGIPVWSITGFFAFGWIPWNTNEKRYQKLREQMQSLPDENSAPLPPAEDTGKGEA